MLITIKKIKSKAKTQLLKITWNIDYFSHKIMDKKMELNSHEFNGKKIILVPHSDDEWIGCSQVIKKYEDVIICNLDQSGNDNMEIHKKRFEELSKTCRLFSKKMITFKSNKTEKLKALISKEKPSYIFVPCFIDWHKEHLKVISILYEALLGISPQNIKIVMYQVSLPIPIEYINNYIPMTKDEFDYKWSYFKSNYITQSFFPSKRFSLNERINGNYFKKYAAEFFIIKDMQDWMREYKYRRITKKEAMKIRINIQRINYVRCEVKKLYDKRR